MNTTAPETLNKLIRQRYPKARAIFWAGSVARGEETNTSDLDLVIVYEKLPNAFREAFIYEGWPIDAFVHDVETLRYFFEESRTGSGISGLIHMVLYGKEITPPSSFSENIKKLAQVFLENGPAVWSKELIDKERFLITDTLDDILAPKSHAERLASAISLFEKLSQFYFRARAKWCASGKSIIRYLEADSPEIAKEFSMSFEDVFQSNDTERLEKLVHKILKPYGGLLWDGYQAEAPAEWRSAESCH